MAVEMAVTVARTVGMVLTGMVGMAEVILVAMVAGVAATAGAMVTGMAVSSIELCMMACGFGSCCVLQACSRQYIL